MKAASTHGAYRGKTIAELLLLLPKDYKNSFLKRAAARRMNRNSFTSKSYHHFKKSDNEKAKVAFACAGTFWDSVNK